MSVLALVSDLMMRSQLSGAASRAGVQLAIAGSETGLLQAAEASRPRLVILDLSHPRLDAASFVPRVRELVGKEGAILAFGPHVHKGLLEAASAAGCDTVISRGQFHASMESILANSAGPANG
jgi:CheY-like chemotaxis protein